MKYKYTVIDISENWEVWYKAIIPSFSRLFVVANTPDELHRVVWIAIEEEITHLKKLSKKIPEPDNISPDKYSWSFILRIKPIAHKKIADIAHSKGCSINKYVSDLIDSNS